MTAARQPPRRGLDEQLIGAVIPTPLPRPAPPPAPMPALPAAVPPAREPVDDLVFDVARPDADGRVSARALLRALRWPAGHRLHIDVTDGLLLITARPDGKQTVGARGALPLPVAARQMCGIHPHQVVLLAAIPARDLLIVHPSNTITRLLAHLHAAVLGGPSHAG
ncbi:hypothetical protein GA0074695_2347 [Micromonospora viridifaciens]|uniref:Uncharacterized protein n=1 Tax=Micromonospora viridifaciens TaxID=1881 RepID=A0A1C4WEE4_MICVI|nr:hypothetical protein [Micromonospora viridifaciens]SCE94509.1 hypothetical protein GA0074695_2347 [Micromonospora viridifaciens]